MADTWRERVEWVLEHFEGGAVADMADRLELSEQNIYKWLRETEESNPHVETVGKMVREYSDLSAYYLLTGEGPKLAEHERDPDQFRAGKRELSEDLRRDLRRVMSKLEGGGGESDGPAGVVDSNADET